MQILSTLEQANVHIKEFVVKMIMLKQLLLVIKFG